MAGLGGASPFSADTAEGKNRKRRKRKKPKPNDFGCLNVGQACGGQDSRCCSGICAGKKPKKGKNDKRRCVAHNVGGCTLDRSVCFIPTPTVALCSTTALCMTTTGNAPFCAENKDFNQQVNCHPCGKDTDCEALGFGAGAACVVLRTEGACLDGCEGVNESSGTACFPPGR